MGRMIYGALLALLVALASGCDEDTKAPPRPVQPIHAHQFRITGTVEAADDSEPIRGIELRLQRMYAQPATSGEDGSFELDVSGFPGCETACDVTALDPDGELNGGQFLSMTQSVALQQTASATASSGAVFEAEGVTFELERAAGGGGGAGDAGSGGSGAAGQGGAGGVGGAGLSGGAAGSGG